MKKIIILLIFITVITVEFLIGCEEQKSNTSDLNIPLSNYIKFSNISIITYWDDISNYNGCSENSIEGFYHDFPDLGPNMNYYFRLEGFVTNMANKPIENITLVIKFIDDKDNILKSVETNVTNSNVNLSNFWNRSLLNPEELGNFNVWCYGQYLIGTPLEQKWDQFKQVNDYKIEIKKLEILNN